MQTACGNCKHISRSIKAAQRHSKTHPIRKADAPAKGSLFTVRWNTKTGMIAALVSSPREVLA